MMVAPSVPQTTSLQKAVAASTKAAGDGAVRAVSATCPKKDSTLKQMSSVCPGGTPRMKVQGSASSGPGAVLLGLGMGGHEGVAPVGRARVVGAARS